MSHNNCIVERDYTFILAGYTILCSGTVVAWEFCYQISDASVTFYPGIWRIAGTTGSSNNTDYKLIQSNSITYNQSIQTSGTYSCQRVNLSTTNQFTAPAESVVGLYSNIETQLLQTNTTQTLRNYHFRGNQSSVTTHGNSDNVTFNIAIRVHLGKWEHKSITLKWMVYMFVYSV